MIILILLVLLLLVSCLALWMTSLNYRTFKGLGVPIVGQLFLVVNSITTSHEKFLRWANYHHKKYGETVCFWAGPIPIISTADPDIMQELSANPNFIHKPVIFYGIFSNVMEGAFSSRVADEKWKHDRKAVVSSLNKEYMQMYHDVFVRRAKELLGRLTSEEGYFDLHPLVTLMAADSIAETLCGIDTNFLIQSRFDVHEGMVRLALKFMSTIYTQPFKRLSPDDIKKMTTIHVEVAEAFIHKNTKKKNDSEYVPMLWKIVQHTKTAAVKDNVMNAVLEALAEAIYSSSICLSATFLFLAMYPEYQDKVLQEQWDIFGNSDEDPLHDDLKRMQYLDMAIKEAIRIVSAPVFGKQVKKPIKIGSYIFPEKSRVLFFLDRLKKNPKYWKHPDRFYPDHFLPEQVSSRPKGAYMAFSAGPRRCPGEEFYMNMSKTVLSIILRKLKLSSPLKQEELRYKPGLFNQLVGPHTVSVEARQPPLH